MEKKYKILWLCTFSNQEKRSHLSLWRNSNQEIGQWIPNLLREMNSDQKYEVHVVSGESWMRKGHQSWQANGVTYHCFQPGVPGVGYSFRTPFEALTRFWFNRRHIKKIVADVKPDIVHIFGLENPQYASAILDLNPKIPVVVTIQGFIHRSQAFLKDYTTKLRVEYEERLMKRCYYYLGDYDSEKVVRSFNPNIIWSHFYFPVNEELIARIPPQEKKFDILFAGGLTAAKGFPDFLEIIRLMKLEDPVIRAGIVGFPNAYKEASAFIENNKLKGNIAWLGRFPDQEGLFTAFKQAKVFLAPTYNDAFASTIRECMLLGTPVVSYKTGGIPYANRDGNENVVLVNQADVTRMASEALSLLKDEKRWGQQAERARQFALKEFSIESNILAMTKMYDQLVG